MKISLRWLCDHIAIDWRTIDVEKLIADFNIKVAEIEKCTQYKLDITDFTVGLVEKIDQDTILCNVPELNINLSLPFRSDAIVGQFYLIKKVNNDVYAWVICADAGLEKDGLLRSFSLHHDQIVDGKWRDQIEAEDYIFEIDNKSITHRPDLWGHRGIAREVAALLDSQLRPEEDFLVTSDVVYGNDALSHQLDSEYRALIATEQCTQLGLVHINAIPWTPSVLKMAFRLMRLDAQFHNFLVDATNYVMFDLGHPMHVFDANKITSNALEVRKAQSGELLMLLDGTTLQLTAADIVIADSTGPVSLAGIKGGGSTGISSMTNNIMLEAACFDAGTIRLSSVHHKLRTDASTRFEKSLDPKNVLKVLQRYIALLNEYKIAHGKQSAVLILGKQVELPVIDISQQYIEERLGTILPKNFVSQTLEKLDFIVSEKQVDNDIVYTITIPSFRATKDVSIKEDIVEEIGRYFGYVHIPKTLPNQVHQASGLTWFDRILTAKKSLAYQAHMHEVYNYGFFDNTFVTQLGWPIEQAVMLKNPLSDDRTTLVTSLIPHLLHNVQSNMANNETLAFFEWARTWHILEDGLQEKQVLAGVWFDKKNNIDFYQCKDHLTNVFETLDILVTWQKPTQSCFWLSAYQGAELVYAGRIIGKAGVLTNKIMHKLGDGNLFAFEIDGDFLKSYVPQQKKYQPVGKYQAIFLDVSVMVPLTTTVADLEALIAQADIRIF